MRITNTISIRIIIDREGVTRCALSFSLIRAQSPISESIATANAGNSTFFSFSVGPPGRPPRFRPAPPSVAVPRPQNPKKVLSPAFAGFFDSLAGWKPRGDALIGSELCEQMSVRWGAL